MTKTAASSLGKEPVIEEENLDEWLKSFPGLLHPHNADLEQIIHSYYAGHDCIKSKCLANYARIEQDLAVRADGRGPEILQRYTLDKLNSLWMRFTDHERPAKYRST